MKKFFLLSIAVAFALSLSAQMPRGNGASGSPQMRVRNSLKLSVNTIQTEDSILINSFIESQKRTKRNFWVDMRNTTYSGLVSGLSTVFISEIVKVAQIRKNQHKKWDEMIRKECYYVDSLTNVNGLKDFYSSGSFDGPLDPSHFNFNGFTLEAEKDGRQVLRAYCHVALDSASLNHLFNHSKFNLVLDSLFFNPYYCHLPNLAANNIVPEEGKTYKRRTSFSYEDRENLSVGLTFAFTSSWYNEAVMLAKDVNLGAFSIQIPVEKEKIVDSIYVYRRDVIDKNREFFKRNKHLFEEAGARADTTYLNIYGDCFIVPRSYMPLSGGIAHWGTGEYNVKVVLSERCTMTENVRKHWHRDYRYINQMKKGSEFLDYMKTLYNQNGSTIVKSILQADSKIVIKELNLDGSSGGSMPSGASSSGRPTNYQQTK